MPSGPAWTPRRLPSWLADLARVVTQAFAQRRKTLSNNFKGALTDADWIALAIDPTARAETLTINNFIAITHRLSQAIE